MKTPKDRLQRVLVIGATPAGLAAANKLGEMGVPVTLVDRDADLDAKLNREEWCFASGVSANYALRPGLIRLLRNPRIKSVLPGEITSLKHTPQGFSAHIKTTPVFVDPDRCTLCGRCADICPSRGPDGSKPIHFGGRQSLPGRPTIDKRRKPLCQEACPLGVNAQGYMALARAGRFAEALELVRQDNVLPGICGRVCTHPCEAACRRAELDEPVAIRDIKRFLADTERDQPIKSPSTSLEARRREAVAIVGSGPAGLAAAAELARLGYSVTVFEREKEPGGLLRYGIGPYRLPRDILDREIRAIQEMGVRFQTGTAVDLADGGEELKKRGFAAVLVAAGCWTDRRLGVPGEDLEGVEGCIEFLSHLYRDGLTQLHERVAVVGDGNAAFDLARALVRLGAQVTLLSWFPEAMIPGDSAEVTAAREEGVTITASTQVTAFLGESGRMKRLRCIATQPGKPDANGIPWPVPVSGAPAFELAFDRAFVAIGQCGDAGRFGKTCPLQFSPTGYVCADDACRTNLPFVFAAGDAATGPSSVVQAMASGRDAARALHRSFVREDAAPLLPGAFAPWRPEDRDFREITPDIPSVARAQMPERQPAARAAGFTEVALGFNESQASGEAARCLQCGACAECLQCVDVCAAPGAIRHGEAVSELVEQAGVVIIADPAAAPSVKGEDVIRAYNTKGSSKDVHGMILQGFAAAAETLILLGGTSQQLKGHGLGFAPPAAQLSAEIRLGVFACRCNDSFGWSAALDETMAALSRRPGVELAEVLPSACTPEGTATLLKTIRERGLTRVVLASCVCCPLDFICSACTEQRSRLKDTLFRGTGINRAMVETCNLRGEVLRLLPSVPELAVDRFKGLIERSIGRVRFLKALPSPARPYNFTTAVIGDSESAIKSAFTLAEAGMDVLLFGGPGKPLADPPSHPNIHSFRGSAVKEIRGTVGNFVVSIETGGTTPQDLHVGAVIVGEQSRRRIPYVPVAGLPSHVVKVDMQERGVTGIPFHMPGATSVPGLFLANPSGINVSERVKGTAAAILAISAMPRGPRQNKGYTVVVDEKRCRGCGRCLQVCPYQAMSLRRNGLGGFHAVVDEALCKGCGNCIPVCPSNAADSPYRDRRYLEQMIEELLVI